MMGSNVSLADIAAVTGNRNNGDGFGNGEGWWVLIILFALFGGWGNNGYGNGAGNGGTQAEVQRGFDTQALMSGIRGIENGVCSLGYDQLAQMNGINTNVMQTGYNITNALNANHNALSAQLAQCCCDQRVGQMQIMNQMGSDTCQVVNAINQSSQNIMQNSNANYRQLHDEIVELRFQDKDAQIAELKSLVNSLNLSISQRNQTSDITSRILTELRNCPVGTYNVPNPNCCYGPWGGGNWNGFLNNNGCCNNNNGCCNN